MTKTSSVAIIAAVLATVVAPIFTATASDAATKNKLALSAASAQASVERPVSLGPQNWTAQY